MMDQTRDKLLYLSIVFNTSVYIIRRNLMLLYAAMSTIELDWNWFVSQFSSIMFTRKCKVALHVISLVSTTFDCMHSAQLQFCS